MRRFAIMIFAALAAADTGQPQVPGAGEGLGQHAAVRRGLLMEELGSTQGDAEMRSEMFLCGVFSLLDRLLPLPACFQTARFDVLAYNRSYRFLIADATQGSTVVYTVTVDSTTRPAGVTPSCIRSTAAADSTAPLQATRRARSTNPAPSAMPTSANRRWGWALRATVP